MILAAITLGEGLGIATLASVLLVGVAAGIRFGKVESKLDVLPTMANDIEDNKTKRHELEVAFKEHAANPSAHAPTN